jgi:hypothetical protein
MILKKGPGFAAILSLLRACTYTQVIVFLSYFPSPLVIHLDHIAHCLGLWRFKFIVSSHDCGYADIDMACPALMMRRSYFVSHGLTYLASADAKVKKDRTSTNSYLTTTTQLCDQTAHLFEGCFIPGLELWRLRSKSRGLEIDS